MHENAPTNNQLVVPDFDDTFEKLCEQFGGRERLSEIANPEILLRWLVENPELITRGIPKSKRIHALTEMHKQAKAACSAKFSELEFQKPLAPKEELNSHPELFVMNGLRRAIRHERQIRVHDRVRQKNSPRGDSRTVRHGTFKKASSLE